MKSLTSLLSAPINRRNFVSSLGIFGAAVGLKPQVAVGATKPGSTAAALDGPRSLMKCRPYLQAPRAGQMTVRWLTRMPSYSWVEFGEDPAALNRKAVQVEEGMIQSDNTIHAVTLQGLQPGKSHYYRAVSRAVTDLTRRKIAFGATETSEVHRFETTAVRAEQIEFLHFNDIHDRPESFGHLMKFQEPGRKDFVFLNGDTFNNQRDEDQIVENLLNPLTQQFATHTPFLFGRGNHETMGNYSRQLREYFDGAEQKFYYGFECGPMYGIVLDTGDARPDNDLTHGAMHAFDAYRETQARWLELEIQKPAFRNARFRVVFVHIPPFYLADSVYTAQHFRAIWMPILNQAKIDLMLCGHTHKHGVHPAVAGNHTFPIVIGGGPVDGKRTLTQVRIDRRHLSLTIKNDQGRVVGELTRASSEAA